MEEEIEIEFKNLLTKTEYEILLKHLNMSGESGKKQMNYYFETDEFDLKQAGSALRIREKLGTYTCTLKQPHAKGLLETHAQLTKEELFNWKKGNIQLPHPIEEKLKQLQIPIHKLKYRGQLETERIEKNWNNCTVVFDISRYNGNVDYELEVEANSYQEGKRIFQRLLNEVHIPERKTPNKIERFFHTVD
ncbi:CYTH domain-containing protein [Salirhabdus salicampi]|uniref:CYTH domain-containing protein n=1 Tax=Salirhabdus salicampi TaxID=476102 RepID=UPI0020C287C2|nr:CYTH domain-containing protein [Salirhabdus salicampi]MCP8615591.1 CYTH domain-containing protein [Salirhabdus salicampi]